MPAAAQIETNPPLAWTPHPMVDYADGGEYRALTDFEIAEMFRGGCSEEDIDEHWRRREERIAKSVSDPLAYGFEPPHWRDVRALLARKDEVYCMGGNGSAKTEIGAKLVVEKLLEAGGMNVLCVARDDTSSKIVQQRAVYKFLPAAIRAVNERGGPKRREVFKKITYSDSNGFANGILVTPTRSTCLFKTVAQFEQSEGGKVSFEGMDFDFYWLDEPPTIDLLRMIQRRAGKRNAKIFLGATMLYGYDAICAEILDGAKITRSLPMNWQWNLGTWSAERGMEQPKGYADPRIKIPELKMDDVQVSGLPPGHMPYVVQPMNISQGVIFMWTHWNLFLPSSRENPAVPGYFDKCVRKSKATVRTWLFGWAEKLTGCQFPNFRANVHIVPQEKIDEMLKAKKLTIYMACDPATARSYFLLWLGIDRMGRMFIFDESPRPEEGEWVSDDGSKGDGTRAYAGRGVNFYKGYIRLREKEYGAAAVRRFGDPRAFATQAAALDGGHSLLELFADVDANDPDNPATAPMPFEPAKVLRSLLAEALSGSLDKVNDAMSYDADKPITIENEPKLYIGERCKNLIKSMLHWDPTQGEKSPYKDPIDVLRYLFGETLYYVDPDVPEICGGSGW